MLMAKKSRILMKNNSFIRAKYNLGLIENRIFVSFLYKAQKQGEHSVICKFTHDEFKAMIKNKSKHSVKQILKVLEDLRKETIYILEQDEDGDFEFIQGGIFSHTKYNSKTEVFELIGDKRIYDILAIDYKEGYTPVNLEVYLELPTTYTQRLYDFIRMWSYKKKEVTYEVDVLREYLMLEDKYPLHRDFKKRVIADSIDKLNATGLFEIDFKENKKGRSVESITFIVKDLDKRKYFENEIQVIDNNNSSMIINLNNYNNYITPATLKRIKEELYMYDFDNEINLGLFIECMKKTLKYTKSEKITIRNNKGYFVKVLKLDLYEYGQLNLSEKEQKDLYKLFKIDNSEQFYNAIKTLDV